MDNAALLDYVMIMAVIAACWKLYDVIIPPAAGPESQRAEPMLSSGALSGSDPAQAPEIPATPLGQALSRICAASGQDSTAAFLDGARQAYETILVAFAAGNLTPARHLLNPDVAATFDAAIRARAERGEVMQMMFIGLRAADVIDADFDGALAHVDLRFVVQMVSVVRNQAGQVVSGDPRRVVDLAEIWSFERDTAAPDPAWLLVATDADE